jgi:hypothetical protein
MRTTADCTRRLPTGLLLLALAGCQDGPAEPLGIDHAAFNKGMTKSEVCHYDADTDTFHKITIADPALDAHIAHGDLMPGEALPGGSGFLDDDCVPMTYVLGTAYNTATFGGPGGSARTEHCAAGSVAVGMEGFWGRYTSHGGWQEIIGQVAMRCAQFRGDATLGSSSTSGTFGAGTSFSTNNPFGASCPAGHILSGGFGKYENGAYIAELGGYCASTSRILSGAAGYDSSLGPWGYTPLPIYMFTGTATCAAGDVVTGITGNAGWAPDKVGFVCRPVLTQPLL